MTRPRIAVFRAVTTLTIACYNLRLQLWRSTPSLRASSAPWLCSSLRTLVPCRVSLTSETGCLGQSQDRTAPSGIAAMTLAHPLGRSPRLPPMLPPRHRMNPMPTPTPPSHQLRSASGTSGRTSTPSSPRWSVMTPTDVPGRRHRHYSARPRRVLAANR